MISEIVPGTQEKTFGSFTKSHHYSIRSASLREPMLYEDTEPGKIQAFECPNLSLQRWIIWPFHTKFQKMDDSNNAVKISQMLRHLHHLLSNAAHY
jgi:hypothetical protein